MTAASTRILRFTGESGGDASPAAGIGCGPAAGTIRLLSLPAIVSWCLARLFPAAIHREAIVGDRLEVTFAPRSEEPK